MKIAILDAGAQYGKVIDRKVRELQVESEIVPMAIPAEELKNYKAIIISGGPESVYGEDAPSYDRDIFSLGIPVLGICYGLQLINFVMGGKVEKKDIREDGQQDITVDTDSLLFKGLSNKQTVLLSHGDSVDERSIAPDFKGIAYSGGLVAGIAHKEKKLYGVQFHPEVDLTTNGKKILANFLFEIAELPATYTMEDRIEKAVSYIRETVGEKKVLVLVSGGVDSTVCAALLHKALGKDRVVALHIDNGFMRKDESLKVKNALEKIGIDLHVVDASEDFYNGKTTVHGKEIGPLKETIHPEEKRNIIGDMFMRVAEKALQEFELQETFLVQGTLRPDLIESASALASGKADTIKTHHNDTGLVRELREKGRVIEPLQDYHKDEVRELGRRLGLPAEIVGRQPFPGPGLAVRIICAEKPYVTSLQNKDLQEFNTSKIHATLLPIQTVGVQGDGRSYSHLVGLSGKKDWDELFKIAKEIPKRMHQVNRVVYVFGDKIEEVDDITPTKPSVDVINQLRLADDIVNQVLFEYDLVSKLSQVPVILFPIGFGVTGNRSIAIRTFITNDFMTGVPAVPGKDIPEEALQKMVSRILDEVPGISRVVYDLTAKPPGTTEWE